jgi:hypothetical protein
MYNKYFSEYTAGELERLKDLRKAMPPFQLGQITALSLRHLSPNVVYSFVIEAREIGSKRAFIKFLNNIKVVGGRIPIENYVYKRIATDEQLRDEFITGFYSMANPLSAQRLRSVIKF